MAAELLKYEAANNPWDAYVYTGATPISASLMRRLAEAADGVRTGESVFLVAQVKRRPKTGHDIIGYFTTAQKAYETQKTEMESGEYLIFGPYQTTEDAGYQPKQVSQVILVLDSGAQIVLDGKEFDCVFWSLSAFDKFVKRYYTGVVADDELQEMRTRFIDTAAPAGVHIPGSKIITTLTVLSPTLLHARNRMGVQLLTTPSEAMVPPPPPFIPL